MRRMLIPTVLLAVLTACDTSGSRGAGTETGAMGGDTTTGGYTTGTGTTGAMANGSGTTRAPDSAERMDDAAILSRLALTNQMEIQSAELAEKQAADAQVKEFARTLGKHHEANLRKVKALQDSLGLSSEPAARANAVETHEKMSDKPLAELSGAEFDRAYLEHQIETHEKNIDMAEDNFLPAAQNPQVKSLVSETIPKLREHLATAQRLENRQ